MKKNFFKKLATVLSLAMVVTSVAPLAGTSASAAATPDIKTRRTTAYEGNSYSYAVKNAKGYTVKWAVSGKLATISKAGKLTVKTKGAKAGKVVVSATFYKKGKKVVTRKDSVAIKVSAKSVAITTAADITALGVGEVADFNRKLTPSNATSKTYYSVTTKDGAATTDATVDTAGKFTATKAGEYVVTATVRNAKTSKVLATTTAAVTVIYKVQEAKQTTVYKVNATFGADVSKVVTKDNITVTDANGVKQVVKGVSFSADGKVVTIELYVSLSDKVNYTVAYGTSKATFVASKGDPVKVAVTPKTVQYGTATTFDVALFDANGVDVSTDDLLKDRVTFTYDNSLAYVDYKVADKKYQINVFQYDKTVDVKATYHTWKYENNKEVSYDSETVKFTSVKEIKDVSNDLIATIEAGNADWANVNSTIAKGKSYNFYVKGTNQDGTKITQADSKMKFESTDSNILTVYKSGSTVTVYGVNEGSAYVKVTYGDTTKVFPVTVGKSSESATLVVDKPATALYVNGATATNPYKLKFTVKDQYGKEVSYTGKTPTITAKTGDSKAIINFATSAGSNEVTVTGVSATVTDANDGTATFEVDFCDKKAYFTIDVVKVTNMTAAYVALDTTSVDVDAAFDTTAPATKTVEITAYAYNTSGQIVGVATGADFTVKYKDKEINSTWNGVANTDTRAYATEAAGVLTFTAADAAAAHGNQAAAGSYNVKAVAFGKEVSAVIIVKNTQSLITVERKDESVTASSAGAVALAGLKFTLEGRELVSGVDFTIDKVKGVVNTTAIASDDITTLVNSGDVVFVESVTVTRMISTTPVTQTIEFKQYIKVK